MPNTINQELWKQLFPSLPLCALPKTIRQNISSEDLITYVKGNLKGIVDTWTNAVRFEGVSGRLAMHEDDERDIEYRQKIVQAAIRNVISQK